MWCAMNKSAKITFSKALSLHSLVTLPNPHSHFPAIIINICMKILNEHEANVDVSQPIDSSHSFLYSWIAQWSSINDFYCFQELKKGQNGGLVQVLIFFQKMTKVLETKYIYTNFMSSEYNCEHAKAYEGIISTSTPDHQTRWQLILLMIVIRSVSHECSHQVPCKWTM